MTAGKATMVVEYWLLMFAFLEETIGSALVFAKHFFLLSNGSSRRNSY
jgi:hypothetical protein